MSGKLSGKLTGNKVDECLCDQQQAPNSLLIYGNDESLIEYRLELFKILHKKNGFNIAILESGEHQLGSILQEMQSIDFFVPKKLIIIKDIKDKAFGELKQSIEELAEIKFVFVNYDIAKSPKLRAFHDSGSQMAASIPCYPLEIKDQINFIQKEFKKAGISYSNEEILKELALKIGSNPFDLRNEVDKIIIRTEKSKEFTPEIMHDVFNQDDDVVSDLTDAIFLKDLEKIGSLLAINRDEDVNYVFLARSLYRQATKLLQAAQSIKAGSTKEIEAKNLNIFFKKVPIFYKQIELWSAKELERLILKIFSFDHNLRSRPEDSLTPNILHLLR